MDETERIMNTPDMGDIKRDTKNAGSDVDRRAKPTPSTDGPNKRADDGGAPHNDAPDTMPARSHYSGEGREG